jgi:REP element-mobilizing transposase RayT
MPKPRKSQISLIDTPYYHCVSRCVRRSFLCGEDKVTGQSYEHRRTWVEERLLFLAAVFAIDICAFSVMSNHTHVVLCVDKDLAESWSKEEVIQHWHKLYQGTLLSQKFQRGDTLSKSEYIARETNKEDNCIGRFWEGRFKSQALLDENAVLACMAYVDLNPILERLGINAEQWLTLTTEFEQHSHTSVGCEHMRHQHKHHTDHQRIRGMAKASALLQA